MFAEKPDYHKRLLSSPRDPSGQGRVSFEAIWAVASERYAGIKAVYAEESDFGHFGSTAVWTSWTPSDDPPDEEAGLRVHYRLGPGWRDEDRDPKVAAAQLAEIAQVVSLEATRIVEERLLPLNRAWTAKGVDS